MAEVTTTYLEMKSPDQLKAKPAPEGLSIVECEIKQFQYNRFLYLLVGEAWQWFDKASWTDAQWRDFAENENLRTWVAHFKGAPAGYYELQQQEGGDHGALRGGGAAFGFERFVGDGVGAVAQFAHIQLLRGRTPRKNWLRISLVLPCFLARGKLADDHGMHTAYSVAHRI